MRASTLLLITGLYLAASLLMMTSAVSADPTPETYSVYSIGQVRIEGDKTQLVLKPEFQPALLRLEDFSHIWVLWWFDRNDTPDMRGILQVHPRRNEQNPLSGVFATRAPVRPNLIGLTLCKVLSVHENIVEIEDIDAFSGTPVLDIKPYIPGMESIPDAVTPHRY